MLGDGPIRIGRDEWVLIRDNPRYPAALVRRLHPGTPLEHYRVVTFDIDPAKRLLVGRFRTLEAADRAVRYPLPTAHVPEALNRFGAYEQRPP
ncbi:hypothetical protein [Herbiconiux sp. A18JL235]|uniref:Uncharacterized protein n=1 Tax=Herbiconiux sp. A18JL235 TaxID=3152363 RepID=A0AB39BF06_9MICO